MRMKLVAALLSSFILMICSCSMEPSVPKGEYLIQGKLLNVPDGAVVALYVVDGAIDSEIARDTIIDGIFMFRDTIKSGVRHLSIGGGKEGDRFPPVGLEVWVASSKIIKITGEDKLLLTWNIKSDIPEQKEGNSFTKATFPEQKDKLKLYVEMDNWSCMMHEKKRVGDEDGVKYCRAKIDSIRKSFKPLDDVITRKKLTHLKEAPVSMIWLRNYYPFARFAHLNKNFTYASDIRELYSRIPDSLKQTELGQEISSFMSLEREVKIGDDMADGILYDLDGKLRHISEFKGKYIFIDFWYVGCGPCIESIPELEEIAEMYKEKLVVVSINTDTKTAWQECIRERKMKGVQWNGRTSGLIGRYNAKGAPHYVLISPDGKIQDIWSGYGKGSLKAKLKDIK